MRVNLGDRVRDQMSGIEGIAFGRSSYVTGCDHIGIKRSGTAPDGKAFDLHWCDEPLIEVMETDAFSAADPERAMAANGGPSLHSFSR